MDHPGDMIGEITLIGTGGGYGESCLVHLGNRNWVIVDSCYDPIQHLFLPIDYLRNLGVDLENNVKLIVCTHWDDDHIRGLSKTLELCKNSKFAIARSNDKAKFLEFVSLDYNKLKERPSNCSTKEFNNCLELIRKRGMDVTEAIADRQLLNLKLNDDIQSSVISLSPSDYTVQQFDQEISTLITEFGPSRKVIYRSPNSRSVALYLKMGNHRAILGADLENKKSEMEGWQNVVEHNQVIDKRASLFKIAHHGSVNAYYDGIWIKLLEDNSISKLTPWNRNNKLPTVEMLKKYCLHTDRLYMTTPIVSQKPKRRNPETEKLIRKFNNKLREVKFNKGMIRSRIDLSNPNAKWTVEKIANAIHVNSEMVLD